MQATKEERTNDFSSNDEIDLFQLWDSLWSQKHIVFSVVFFVVFGAVLYLVIAKKTYEAVAVVLPPEPGAISELSAPGIEHISVSEIYNRFVEKLNAADVQMAVAEEEVLKLYFFTDEETSRDLVLEGLGDSLTITLPVEPKSKSLLADSKAVNLTFQATEADIAQTFIAALLANAEVEAKREIVGNVNLEIDRGIDLKSRLFALKDKAISDEIEAEIERLLEADRLESAKLQERIEQLHKKAEQDRSSRIARLEESLEVAKKLGITTPIDPLDYESRGKAEAKIDMKNRDPGGYWLGTKILSADIESLRSRKDDSPFIAELTELRKELAMLATNERVEMLKDRQSNLFFSEELRNLKNEIAMLEVARTKISQAKFDVYKYAQRPIVPSNPIKPKKFLVLAISILLGGMLGIMIALIRSAVLNRSRNEPI